MNSNIPTLAQMVEFAAAAGKLLRESYGKHHQVNHKGRIDLVTEMDQQSERLLIDRILTNFPGHKIFTEESGELSGQIEHCWYIDPLDGTTNYAHHLPIFAISLAYAREGEVQLGVVYDPMRDECFSAQKGQGAWLNGAPLQVSATDELLYALLSTGFPYDIETTEKNLTCFTHFSRLSQGVRRMGAAALDLCYVASGRIDGYWEQKLQSWDLAAGALIVQEAGGIITSLQGSPDYLTPPYSTLAAAPAVHAQMLAEFKKMF